MNFLLRNCHVMRFQAPRKAHQDRNFGRFVSSRALPRPSQPRHSFHEEKNRAAAIIMSSSSSSASSAAAVVTNAGGDRTFLQHVVVMRHGDRIDNSEPLWISTAVRPWDPPLTEGGKIRAWSTGKKLRSCKEFRIDRVFVSPFIRCIQTAAQVVSALCAVDDNATLLAETSANAVIDPSKVKVSIEYGLCEMMNREAIRVNRIPTDDKWALDMSELEAMLPAGTYDHSPVPIYQKIPKWEEQPSAARNRYKEVIVALADKYPQENLLLVTHGEGVGVAVSAFLKDMVVYDVEYCAYAHSQRQISFSPSGGFNAENFKVLTKNAQTGICFYSKEEDY